ncbi:hypothetical protein D3C87_925420 [compost metagenome]
MLDFDRQNVGHRPKDNSRKQIMSPSLAAKNVMRDAYPLSRYGKLDNVFYHAVQFIRPRVTKEFTMRRARAIWEGAARRIDSEEMDALREALIEENIREQRELRQRLAALDASIATFHAAQTGRPVASSGASQG